MTKNALDPRQVHKDFALWRTAAQARRRKWMRDNGASAATANKGCTFLTAADGWQGAAEKYAGSEALAEAHKQIADLTALNTRLDRHISSSYDFLVLELGLDPKDPPTQTEILARIKALKAIAHDRTK